MLISMLTEVTSNIFTSELFLWGQPSEAISYWEQSGMWHKQAYGRRGHRKSEHVFSSELQSCDFTSCIFMQMSEWQEATIPHPEDGHE